MTRCGERFKPIAFPKTNRFATCYATLTMYILFLVDLSSTYYPSPHFEWKYFSQINFFDTFESFTLYLSISFFLLTLPFYSILFQLYPSLFFLSQFHSLLSLKRPVFSFLSPIFSCSKNHSTLSLLSLSPMPSLFLRSLWQRIYRYIWEP